MVEAILVGKERRLNRRVMAMANHDLLELVACTPASGLEKAQIENQVDNVREWLFTPMARFASFAALNEWLALRCRATEPARASDRAQPEHCEPFIREQPLLRALSATFDGYLEQMLRASCTSLVRIDSNRYRWLVHLISQLYEKASLSITTDLAFGERVSFSATPR